MLRKLEQKLASPNKLSLHFWASQLEHCKTGNKVAELLLVQRKLFFG